MTEARQTAIVEVYGTEVGRLSRDRSGAVQLVLDSEWLTNDQLPRLGLGFVINPGNRKAGTGLPAWFENLLPEAGSPLRSHICAGLGLPEHDSPGLLTALGADLPGAVVVRGMLGRANKGAGSDPISAESPWRFSLAGMQLKLSMSLVKNRLSIPVYGQDGDWIVKFSGRFDQLPEVEYTTLRWAGAMGFEVPELRLLPSSAVLGVPDDLLASPTVFAIRRFDRLPGGERVHQEDFSQVLEIDPRHKYGDSGPRPVSYDSLALLVKDAAGQDSQLEFVRRLAMTVACGNNDAHLKNFSFQWPNGDKMPRMSPLYDVVSTIAWPEFGWSKGTPRLALGFGKTRSFAELDRHRLQRFCMRGQVDQGEMVFMNTLVEARKIWLNEIMVEAPERMRTCIEDHWNRVPLLREIA